MLKNQLIILIFAVLSVESLNAIWINLGMEGNIQAVTNRGIYEFTAHVLGRNPEDFISLSVHLNGQSYEIELNDNVPAAAVNAALQNEECQVSVII